MRLKFIIFFFLTFNTICYSQNYSLEKNNFNIINDIIKDTIKSEVSYKSPTKALIMSSILPGLGQFYNESYWKIPIIYGLSAFFIYEYIDYNKKFKDYNTKFEASVTPDNPYGSYYLKSYREYYRDKRDAFIWYGGFLYLINIADAFVDAHLYNFNVSDNVSIEIKSYITNNFLCLKINF